MVDTGLIPSAARSFHVPTQRVETRKRGNYDIAPVFPSGILFLPHDDIDIVFNNHNDFDWISLGFCR